MATFADSLRQKNAIHNQQFCNTPEDRVEVTAKRLLAEFQKLCTSNAEDGSNSVTHEYQTFGWSFLNLVEKSAACRDTRAVVEVLKKEFSSLGFRRYEINHYAYDAGKYCLIHIYACW